MEVLLEILLASSAIASSFLINKKLDMSAAGKKPLTGDPKIRVEALRQLKESKNGIFTSSGKVRVKIEHAENEHTYAYYYEHKVNPFLRLIYNKESKTVMRKVAFANPNHAEIVLILEAFEQKILERHLGKLTIMDNLSSQSEVKERFNELTLRIRHMTIHTQIDENQLRDITENVEPLLRDVMEKFEEMSPPYQEMYASKTLDIFYSIEKKIKGIECLLEEKKQAALACYFSDIEKQVLSFREETK